MYIIAQPEMFISINRHHIFLGVIYQLDGMDIDDLPYELHALNYFKAIVPYAFQKIESISTTSNVIDELLADVLTGIDNKDKFAQLAGVKFGNHPDGHPRV